MTITYVLYAVVSYDIVDSDISCHIDSHIPTTLL